mmetsp:Transcript_20648/g.41515  ORF Transcript_20648/g.41515 Transcript_20648/m.41515 type:complete len:86 (-) Transcript_20648:85-342(-)
MEKTIQSWLGKFLVAGAGGTSGFIGIVQRVDRLYLIDNVMSSKQVSPPSSCRTLMSRIFRAQGGFHGILSTRQDTTVHFYLVASG